MRIRVTGPAISGAPAPGDIGEVDDKLGEAMVRRGFAVRIDTLTDRLGRGHVADKVIVDDPPAPGVAGRKPIVKPPVDIPEDAASFFDDEPLGS